MIVGKMLKEKYGFDSEAVIDMFCDQYGYSQKFVKDLLNDKWNDLLICHIEDIIDFTKIERPLLDSWCDEYSFSNTCAPMGKPYDNPMPELLQIDLSPFKPKLFITTRPEGNTIRAGFFPNPGEEEFKPGPDDLTPRAAELLTAIGLAPITIKRDDDGGLAKKLASSEAAYVTRPAMEILDYPNQLSLARRNEDVPEASQEQMQALFDRVKERYKTNPVHIRSELTIKDLSDPESVDIYGYPSVSGVVLKPEPEVGYAMVPLELLETLADIASDEGFSIPANKAYDIINAVKGE